ncbi:MAG: peptidyl-prolyl cis-trans isomerase [Alphaproteobacteria bacterium]
MLQKIRDKTAGVVVKVLFLFLVLSFAVWGIGDYKFLQRAETPAISIGGDAVPADQVRLEFQRDLDRLRRSLGEIDRDVLRQFGVAGQSVERVANQRTLDRAAERMSLVVSDAVVRQRIPEDPNFRGAAGFDANAFRRRLQENGFTEQRYVDLLRGDAARSALVEAVATALPAPAAIAEALFRHREEKRRGDTLFVPASSMPDPGTPSDADLQSAYEANIERFTDPEFRSGAVVRIGLEEVRASIPVEEPQLRAEFEARRREFSTPERRTVEILRFDDEAAAAAARKEIEGGADLLDVAAKAGQTPEQVRAFGKVAASGLPAELSRPVFALAANEVSAPIATPLGVFLGRTTAIEPGVEPSFEDMRGALADEIVRRAAAEAAYRTATKVEEGINEGKPLPEAAAAAGVQVVAIEAADMAGRDRRGLPIPVLASAPEALRAFGEAIIGRDSQLIETRSGAFFFVRVDGVSPSEKRPLAAVRDDVAAIWAAGRRDAAARARAEQLAAEIRGGKDVAAAGQAFELQPQQPPAMHRDGRVEGTQQREPSALAARLFQLKPGEVGTAATGEGYFVVRLAEVIAADPAQAQPALQRLSDGLSQAIAAELGQQYLKALRERLKVVVDPAAVDRLYQN